MRAPATLIAALLLAACSAPAFHQPDAATPATWKEAPAADDAHWETAQLAPLQADGRWWRIFQDSELDDLMARANAGNQAAAQAVARVQEARAYAGIARADRTPQLGVSAGGERVRQSPLELQLPAGTPVAPSNVVQLNLTASYEVDLFARVSSQVAAANSDLGVSAATLRAVMLSLQADVAQTWFRLRATDAELAALDQAVALRERSLAINERRFTLGDIGEFDLVRARAELADARIEAIGLQQQRSMAEHALAVLLGAAPAQFTQGVRPLIDSTLPVIPPGLPSALLQRRPDLQAAQQAMEAANARIGVARAARFPALTFQTGAGGIGTSLADVFSWSSRSWFAGALLSMPVIDGGRNAARIAASQAALEESVATFRQRVLGAYADVEDNLSSLRILSGQTAQVDVALAASRRAAALAQNLYTAGRTTYLDQLDAERELRKAERQAAQIRGARAIATVGLIRALGGGWDGTTPTPLAHN